MLGGSNCHGHGKAAGDQDCRVERTQLEREVVAALDEGTQVLEAVDGVSGEESAEEHDLLGDKRPHTHVGGFVLLLQILELVIQGY